MNQDQVKEQLLRLQDDVEEFFLIFSGKSSKKVNGLYHPDTREIIIHNRNFQNDNALMYTAIHEFAHHVHFTTSAVPVGPRSHTLEFRGILHRLLERAEGLSIYRNDFETDPDFMAMTWRLKNEFLAKNGTVMKAFGAALADAERLCTDRGARFDDYIERVLAMDRKTASTLIRIHGYDLNPQIGYANMATVAGIRNDERRTEAVRLFESGKSPDTVKMAVRSPSESEQPDPVQKLEKERQRIKRTIASLESKLAAVEDRITRMAG